MKKDLEYYISCFFNLRRTTRNGEKSPHKVVVLLAVIQAVKDGTLTSNLVTPDEIFNNIFLNVWHERVGVSANFEDSLFPGFYNLQNEDFWHLLPWSESEKQKRCIDIDSLRSVYQGALIDEELYSLFLMPNTCQKLQDILLSLLGTYRSSTRFVSIDDYLKSLLTSTPPIKKDVRYFINLIEPVANAAKSDKKAKLKLILLLSTIEHIEWKLKYSGITNFIPLLATWEGVFLNNVRTYMGIIGRESTLFSSPFIQMGELSFWHLRPCDSTYIITGHAMKTFANLQNIYEGVDIDEEFINLIKVPKTREKLKAFLVKGITKNNTALK